MANRDADCASYDRGRRGFLKFSAQSAAALAMVHAGASAFGEANPKPMPEHAPMAMGLLIKPFPDAEKKIAMVKELGFKTCFLSLDSYLGKFTPELATTMRGLFDKYELIATTAEVVGPPPLKWNFTEGPATIGVVPRATRPARIDALKQTSDFAYRVGIKRIQTHCGFIPEDPKDPLYEEAVLAIRSLAEHCAGNGQSFLMETGQETPTTMLRAIKDVDRHNLGVGLDTANLILYGKANPVDAIEILGPHIQATHMKDGNWPTNPSELGEEVLIGKGKVDFTKVLTSLHKLGYKGAVTIERETSGPQQIADVREEKLYLERILAQVLHS
ncbi:sugar phosphate isomerase/epimerase family protein [Terriglobus saanensis]|uniref:Xylose isomerase domain-containing protein TIM barrel n=1 Tax=Terriglobus saanensis (strain ATCC BAA-1853 / DSM 23119 / SP1PR4) TaxID=401053 RepID=E8V357_TERSS|nr:sugar phosphate isomerase/epimerase family protein [Terriglobus saanensis]ADV81332.1 Xylose isomerase domain-containing protein TIM barrel [Terriglobus saanensis SP1PR4]